MVDPVGGSGGASNIGATNRNQSKNQIEKQAEAIGKSRGLDRVELSEEALSLADAEASAARTRAILEENVEETLSSDASRFDKLL